MMQEIIASMSRNSKEVEERVEDVSRFLAVNRFGIDVLHSHFLPLYITSNCSKG